MRWLDRFRLPGSDSRPSWKPRALVLGLLVLLVFVPANRPAQAAERTEAFGVRVGGGNYGLSLELAVYTLRWEHVYVTVAHVGAAGLRGLTAWAGPTVGFPLSLDAAGRHEMRFGLSPLFSYTINGPENRPSSCTHEASSPTGLLGFGLGLEILYGYRISDAVAIQAGGRLIAPVAGSKDPDPGSCHPFPSGLGFVGVVF